MSIILSHSYAQSVHSFFFFFIFRPPPRSTLFPYTTLFRSLDDSIRSARNGTRLDRHRFNPTAQRTGPTNAGVTRERSEEHTSELQSPDHLVCRLLLEKKKNMTKYLSSTQKPSR